MLVPSSRRYSFCGSKSWRFLLSAPCMQACVGCSLCGPGINTLEHLSEILVEVRVWSSELKSCRGPCDKILWRCWCNPLRFPSMKILNLEDILWEVLACKLWWYALRGLLLQFYKMLYNVLATWSCEILSRPWKNNSILWRYPLPIQYNITGMMDTVQ